MGVVWVVESPKATDWQMAHTLLGDFAVRVVASCNSFARLAVTAKSAPPNLVIVSQGVSDFDSDLVAGALAKFMPESKLVFVQSNSAIAVEDIQIHQLATDQFQLLVSDKVDNFTFSRFVRRFLAGDRSQRGESASVSYRDLEFDADRFICKFMATGATDVLPLKEARILTVLMRKPGTCITREEIQSLAWPGVNVGSRTIDSHVSRLRKRLEDSEVVIESVYGNGYILR